MFKKYSKISNQVSRLENTLIKDLPGIITKVFNILKFKQWRCL